MSSEPEGLAEARRAAVEFHLGEILDVGVVKQGASPCFRIDAGAGVFAVKREVADALDLAAEVALRLNGQGFPQAVFRRTEAGSLLSSDGFTATAWLPGIPRERPEPEESAPLMRALSRYQELLAAPFPVPPELRECRTVWTQLASVDHLLGDLLEECRGIPEAAPAVAAAAGLLRERRDAIAALPRQLIHGDLGGGNILFAPDTVLFIDFTPHWDSHLAGLGACLYWSHVSATNAVPDASRIAEEVDVYAALRHLTPIELELIPAMMVKEAYRRVATAIHLGWHGDPGRAAAWDWRLRCLVALTTEAG
jgi:Ser/Thr protein kinase RdoA (MazF antagonist)